MAAQRVCLTMKGLYAAERAGTSFCCLIYRKLQLARFNWNLFTDENQFDKNLGDLVARMKEKLKELTAEENDNGNGGKARTKKGDSWRWHTLDLCLCGRDLRVTIRC